MSVFHPEMYAASLSDIDLLKLKEAGIRLVLLDNDNTIGAAVDTAVAPEADAFVKEVRKAGMDAMVLSNNFSYRARERAERLGLSYIGFCLKPLKQSYERAMMLKGVRKEECVMIGDQVITDICGANRCGMHTILIDRRQERDHIFGYVTRALSHMVQKFVTDIPDKGEYYGNL